MNVIFVLFLLLSFRYLIDCYLIKISICAVNLVLLFIDLMIKNALLNLFTVTKGKASFSLSRRKDGRFYRLCRISGYFSAKAA